MNVNKKISASTIPEVLVAMVIICMVFSMSMMIIVNVSRQGFSTGRQQAKMEVDYLAQQTLRDRNFIDQRIEEGEHIIIREIINHETVPNLLLISISAMSKEGKTLYTEKRLIYAPYEK